MISADLTGSSLFNSTDELLLSFCLDAHQGNESRAHFCVQRADTLSRLWWVASYLGRLQISRTKVKKLQNPNAC